MSDQPTNKPDDEGARSFGVMLAAIEGGDLHDELSRVLRETCAELSRQADHYHAKAKGALSLKLAIEVDPTGIVVVKGSVEAKTPKPKRNGQAFWLTKGGNLSVENPRQMSLPIRAVPSAPPVVRDIPVQPVEVRG